MKYKHSKNETLESHQINRMKHRTISRDRKDREVSLRFGAHEPPPQTTSNSSVIRSVKAEPAASSIAAAHTRRIHTIHTSQQSLVPSHKAVTKSWMEQLRLEIVQIENRLPDTRTFLSLFECRSGSGSR